MKLFKKCLMAAMLLLTVTLTYAQPKGNWKEMHDFHGVISKTFHPAEENDLGPLKENAGELLTLAKAWQQSKVPQGYDQQVTAPILEKLVQQFVKIQAAVKAKKSDPDLKKMISDGHDIFHELMEKCNK